MAVYETAFIIIEKLLTTDIVLAQKTKPYFPQNIRKKVLEDVKKM